MRCPQAGQTALGCTSPSRCRTRSGEANLARGRKLQCPQESSQFRRGMYRIRAHSSTTEDVEDFWERVKTGDMHDRVTAEATRLLACHEYWHTCKPPSQGVPLVLPGGTSPWSTEAQSPQGLGMSMNVQCIDLYDLCSTLSYYKSCKSMIIELRVAARCMPRRVRFYGLLPPSAPACVWPCVAPFMLQTSQERCGEARRRGIGSRACSSWCVRLWGVS